MRHTEPMFDEVEFLTRVSGYLDDDTLRLPEPVRTSLSQLVNNGLLPRLKNPDAPLNIVFAGPTGSGKSTLINSVAGRWVTEPGILRPTTTRPLVYSHSEHATPFVSAIRYDRVTGVSPILESISLIDTPDLDSTNLENRTRAMDAISRADVVVFVISALRYADLVPWEVFREVVARGVPIVFVLNRISQQTSGVVTDFRRRARHEGMSMRVVRVEEHQIGGGVLPAASVRELRRAIVACLPSTNQATNRVGKGVEYVIDELVAMRHDLEASQELLQRVRNQVEPSLSLPGSFKPEVHHDRWLGEIARVPILARRSRWMPAYELVRDDLVTEIAVALEKDLHLISMNESRIEVDLSESRVRAGVATPTDTILKEWMSQVDPGGEVSSLSRRRSREKVLTAIAATTKLFSDPSGRSSVSMAGLIATSNRHKTTKEAVDRAAEDLRQRIQGIFVEAQSQLEWLSLARELAGVELLVDSATVGTGEPIVAHA
ncbi:MAG TPA: GTPase domain-containing protein [Acidimicrobiia bacterium]